MEPINESEDGVFGRSEYAKKDFWDKRFSELILEIMIEITDFLIGIQVGKN